MPGDQNAQTNTNTAPPGGLQIFLLNDTQVANEYAHLWSADVSHPLNPLNINEMGDSVANSDAWTGIQNVDGTNSFFNLGANNATFGRTGAVNENWVNSSIGQRVDIPEWTYAMSGVLTMPIPEPRAFTTTTVCKRMYSNP